MEERWQSLLYCLEVGQFTEKPVLWQAREEASAWKGVSLARDEGINATRAHFHRVIIDDSTRDGSMKKLQDVVLAPVVWKALLLCVMR